MTRKRFGHKVARLRTKRIGSRSQLVRRLDDELDADDPSYNSISEAWLARLERGEVVNLRRPVIEALCRALGCTPQERLHLMQLADRSPFSESDPVADVLTSVMVLLFSETHQPLSKLIGKREATELTEKEMLVFVATAIEMVTTEHQGG